MLEKTEAIVLAELRCELAIAKLHVANQFRWVFAALLALLFSLEGAALDGLVIGLLAFYLVPLSYRRELKSESCAYEKATGVSFQSKIEVSEP